MRWQGALATTSRMGVVFEGEIRRVLRSGWGMAAVVMGLAVGLVYTGSLLEIRQADQAHTLARFVDMVDWLLWSSFAVAAVTGATTLLHDKQHGALELYFTRSLTPGEYLAGKCLAQFTVSAGVIFLPVVAYVLMAHLLFADHPENWGLAIPVGLAVGVGWGLLVTGLALGVSAVGRSASGAVVIIAGAFVLVEVVLWRLMEALTDNVYVALISPLAGARQITAWLSKEPLPHGFEVHWAAIIWFVLVALGWGLLFWRRPRVRGAEGVGG